MFHILSDTRLTATLPATASGKIAVTTPAGTAASATNFTVTPGATAVPFIAHPGAPITVTASGMDPYTAMDVFFDTTDVALAVSNASGIATLTLSVPATASPIRHWITFDERSTHKATQAPIVVNTDWLQGAYGPGGTGYNPFETALDPTTVPTLDTLWSRQIDMYGNAQPLVEFRGEVFVANTSGVLRAFSPTGALVWQASPGGFMSGRSPVIYGTNIYVSNATSVFAYAINCGVGGATCSPLWTAAVPSYNGGGLTAFNGTLYIGGSDGNVYPINPATGALGTPFFAYNNTDGGISTPIAFGNDGRIAYGVASHIQFQSGPSSSETTFTAYVPGVTFYGETAYSGSNDGSVREIGGTGWSTTLPTPGCAAPRPAAAYGLVFVGDCQDVWAFNAANGANLWGFNGGAVTGITVANHVVYACQGFSVVALNAATGAYLWTGSPCSSAPLVANGILYSVSANLYASTIPALSPNIPHHPPATSTLRRNLALTPIRTPEILPPPQP